MNTIIFRTVAPGIAALMLVFSIFVLLRGHNEPGGGFIGGLVAGCAFMLLYLAGGDRSLCRREPLAAEAFLGVGISLAALAGAVGWANGGEYLESGALAGTLPGLGEVKLSSGLVFDTGVYLVVVGLVLALLRSLGREEVREA